jgi:hypothetical protein
LTGNYIGVYGFYEYMHVARPVRNGVPLLIAAGVFCAAYAQTPDPAPTPIADIISHRLRFEGKVVRLTGAIRGTHYGPALENDDRAEAIRVKFLEERKPRTGGVVADALYLQFKEIATSLYAPAIQLEPRAKIDVVGRIELLRRNGKLADSYNIFTESPVWFVPLRVLHLEAVRPSGDVQPAK